MKNLFHTLWDGEPVIVLGVISTVAAGLATAGIIPAFVAPIIVGISTVVQRQKVSPTKKR